MDIGERIARLWEHPANVHSKELQSLAMAVGRDIRPGGKHLMAIKPGRPPFPIPTHPGTLKVGTVRRILKRLKEDYELERQETYKEEGQEDNEQEGQEPDREGG